MVHCLPAPSRAAMGGLSCLYQTFELMIGFPFRLSLDFHPFLDSFSYLLFAHSSL
jgi:hypothetical protein